MSSDGVTWLFVSPEGKAHAVYAANLSPTMLRGRRMLAACGQYSDNWIAGDITLTNQCRTCVKILNARA